MRSDTTATVFDKCKCYRTSEELSLDLARSIMIGDALTDLFGAKAAGIGRLGLILGGRGAVQAKLPQAAELVQMCIFDQLRESLAELVLVDS